MTAFIYEYRLCVPSQLLMGTAHERMMLIIVTLVPFDARSTWFHILCKELFIVLGVHWLDFNILLMLSV